MGQIRFYHLNLQCDLLLVWSLDYSLLQLISDESNIAAIIVDNMCYNLLIDMNTLDTLKKYSTCLGHWAFQDLFTITHFIRMGAIWFGKHSFYSAVLDSMMSWETIWADRVSILDLINHRSILLITSFLEFWAVRNWWETNIIYCFPMKIWAAVLQHGHSGISLSQDIGAAVIFFFCQGPLSTLSEWEHLFFSVGSLFLKRALTFLLLVSIFLATFADIHS